MSGANDDAPRSHYHFTISLRFRHPKMDPEDITATIGILPSHSWKAGELRRTPKGTPLDGSYESTYWTAEISSGQHPVELNGAIFESLTRLSGHRAFFHQIRAQNGSVEFSIGWFFDNQSGETLDYRCLALAGDLKIDLSLDVYPPD